MPSSAAQSARRERLARQAARRQAVTALQIAECGIRYTISVLANGTGPAEARSAVVEMAAELVAVADVLRQTARLCPHCGKPIDTTPRPGRRRIYCGDPCRWKRGHQRAADLGLSRRSSVNGPSGLPGAPRMIERTCTIGKGPP
jgi:hypothetical protein